ncbi:hypothetical protein WJ02_14550 [Burkholderia vietnamiensis]|nr:hypothetical protein WJ02_14550 [Burkholderia vietnamiensis]
MQITILGPSAEQLVLLGERWDAAVEEMEQRAKAREKAASEPALPPDMEVLGGPSVFDVDALSSYQGSDPSVTNGSSITLLLEFAGRSIVLAGDSHAEPLLRAWRHLEKREVDLLKVSHHGSRNNTTLELINALQPSMALICTDGSSHGHPDQECIAMLVAPVGSKQLFTNYTYENIQAWDTEYLRSKYNFSVESGDGTLEITL